MTAAAMFDGHNDVLLKLWLAARDGGDPAALFAEGCDGHLDLPRIRAGGFAGGFFATYVAVFAILLLSMMSVGLDQVTAFSAVAACLNNLGPGLGDVSYHYGELSGVAKLILSFAMLLGRLEIFTLFVLFTPAFWRA